MGKMLLINPALCTGCRACEIGCSEQKESRIAPSLSRITVYAWEEEGVAVPMVCAQCEEPFCQKVCPTNALTRDQAGVLQVDDAQCVGCKMCIQACPFGGIAFDPGAKRLIKCDLCDGDPACVANCPTRALEFVEEGAAHDGRRRNYAERLKGSFGGVNR